MELKSYQKKVIADLTRYLELLNETKSDAAAFRLFWQEKSAPTLGLYQNVIPGVPNLCFKVPTGGGKTFIACNAVRPIFDALPATKTKAVVWLVPSDAILTQTAKSLKNPQHPYRQKIDVDFGGRVEVYTKQELLNGQNFNPTAVTEQLSVMVLSYDSFRGRGKEVLKAYQENSNLAEFAKVLGKPDSPIEKADETALFQIINQLNPLVIVDESHHARSELSLEMLENFNPCFVLDLTATPKKESNIISYVDAVQLKNEHMVKLPVIVYNRDSQSEVLIDAIDLRNKLEEIASAEYAKTGKYIRPIALFQAQPKGKEDATTFEKLRDKLVDAGIPAEQIAIRTADVNELKNVELMSLSCPIRYIITVNALKEGWDCPFAYILASLANKTSQVDVEQILGRILRLPHTSQHTQSALNMSYVLTSSNDFNNTVAHIVKGLNSAGFSDKDYRIGESAKPQVPEQPAEQITLPDQQGCPEMEPPLETAEDDFSGLDGKSIGAELERRREQAQTPETAPKADTMLDAAAEVEKAYTDAIQQTDNDPMMDNLPWEVRDKVKSFQVNPQFREDIETLQIPQFFLKVEQSLFTDGSFELLDKEMLAEGFTLKGKAYDIDFAAADDEIREIDVREQDGGLPKVFKMESAEQRYFKEWFNNLPPESRVRQCKEMLRYYGPAYLTAVGTMSSAATMAVALNCARKSKVLRKDMVSFGIPLFANIHLCGSVLTEVFFCMTISKILYGKLPGIGTMILFCLLLGIFAIGAPGVPGGTVMASLGLITGVLMFDDAGTALMLAIFALQDSFGTACNVTGDGALTLMLTGYAEKHGIQENQNIESPIL